MEMISKVVEFFSFLYIKSKIAFKPAFRIISKLAEQLKLRVQRGFKKGLYYEINFIFIILKKWQSIPIIKTLEQMNEFNGLRTASLKVILIIMIITNFKV